MAGFIAGTSQDLLTSNVAVAANTETEICTITINNAAFADIEVDYMLNSAATDGIEIKFLRVEPGSGVNPVNPYQPLSVDPDGTLNIYRLSFVLHAGEYRLVVKNNDATYEANIISVKQINWTWG